MTGSSFDDFIKDFTGWAQAQPEILAAVIAGSLARNDGTADQWSDLDIFTYATAPGRFIEESSWLSQFGEIWAKALDHTPRGEPEWYILYEGGRKVDILFMDIHKLEGERLSDWVQHPDFSDVLPRGMRVLFDKTPSRGELPNLAVRTVGLALTQENLDSLSNHFFLTALKAGRLLHRSDVWRARQVVDEGLKTHLLTMIEWHAMSLNGPSRDVWYDGRFMTKWADPKVLERLPACFGGFEMKRLWDAFRNTMDLFDDLGREIAARKGLVYPAHVSENVRKWVLKNPV